MQAFSISGPTAFKYLSALFNAQALVVYTSEELLKEKAGALTEEQAANIKNNINNAQNAMFIIYQEMLLAGVPDYLLSEYVPRLNNPS